MVMALHKFALLGGKVPAATGMRAAGRPPKAGRRTSFAAAAAPPGLWPAGCSPKTLPHRAQRFSACFYGKVFAFCGLCFFADFALFAAGTERIARPPQGQTNGSILSTLAACRFWAFAVGRNSPHPRKGKADGSFLATLAACRFWVFAVGKNSPHPRKGKADGSFLATLAVCRFWAFAVGKNSPRPP